MQNFTPGKTKASRDKLIGVLREAVDDLSLVDANRFVVYIVLFLGVLIIWAQGSIIFMFQGIAGICHGLIEAVANVSIKDLFRTLLFIVAFPFVLLWLSIDLARILIWFGFSAARKFTGGKA